MVRHADIDIFVIKEEIYYTHIPWEAVELEGIRKMWTRDFIVVSTGKNRRQGKQV